MMYLAFRFPILYFSCLDANSSRLEKSNQANFVPRVTNLNISPFTFPSTFHTEYVNGITFPNRVGVRKTSFTFSEVDISPDLTKSI